MLLDTNMVDAVRNWFIHGLNPGSCTAAILNGNFKRAEQSAHVLLKTNDKFTFQEYYDNLRSIVPPCLLDQDEKFSGLLNMKASLRTVVKFELALMADTMGIAHQWYEQAMDMRKAYANGHIKERHKNWGCSSDG